jgi:pyruvate kinase
MLLFDTPHAGQEVVVVAVGPEAYTSWEGYVEEDSGRAVIGLSYDKLCQFLKPGNTILLSDGTITIQVRTCSVCTRALEMTVGCVL